MPGIWLSEGPGSGDIEASLSDLPRLFATGLETIPAAIPYLGRRRASFGSGPIGWRPCRDRASASAGAAA